jgi:hypothetical protein
MGWRHRRRQREGEPWRSASSKDETTVQQQIRCEFRKLTRWLALLALVLALLLLLGGTVTDYRSCKRQEPVRHALRGAADYWRAHGRPDLARGINAPRIDCFRLPPGE